MTVDFRDYFWGEKNNGFDVLYHNMKYGYSASKELVEFFRERSVIEETHSKLLSKLAKQASSGCSNGTFAPLWQVFKASSEKLSSLHTQMVQRFQDLLKDVQKYCDEQHRKHKQVKEEELGTLEVVQSIQQTATALNKIKEIYNNRCLEYEKLKKENGSAKEVEKAELKCKKSCEDYRGCIEKYGNVRSEFERKMTISSQHFQDIEEAHLRQMKEFLTSYVQVLESGHALIGQVHIEFRQQCNAMDVSKLLEQFVSARGTGKEKPGPIEFEEADLSSLNHVLAPEVVEVTNGGDRGNKKEGKKLSPPGKSKPSRRTTSLLDLFFSNPGQEGMTSQPSSSPQVEPLARTSFRASKWFLKSKRDKRKERKKKKLNGAKEQESGSVEDCEVEEKKTQEAVTVVDAEGFTIRPTAQISENSFYSSSEGESADEEEKEKKIHIEIKPLSNGAHLSASVDELRATIGTLTLSPVAQHVNRRALSSTVSTPEEGPLKSKPDADVFSLFSPTTSSASTPTGFASGITSPAPTETTPSSGGRYSGLGEIFSDTSQNSESNNAELTKLHLNGSSQGYVPTAASGSVIPRPPSRRSVEPSSRGRMSPLPNAMTRTESVGSLTSDFKATPMSVGSSRGPSPLTIGMCDSIPLAVAFQEVVHAFFRGTDETRCQVRLLGDMKVSFPAGIVQALANNPSPATLTFRVSKVNKWENVLPNKQLIIQDLSASNGEQHVFEFNMTALIALLRKQYEQTPNASYFNIDILKYHIKHQPGAKSTPLHLVAYWKCDETTTDLKIDYKYNLSGLSTMAPITNISIIVPVDGGVTNVQSRPTVQWNNETQRATWWITELSHHSEGGGLGSLRARFDLSSGPSTPSTLAAQFVCMGTSMSGADFELLGLGYRLSLVKKQVVAGKYLCEGELNSSYA